MPAESTVLEVAELDDWGSIDMCSDPDESILRLGSKHNSHDWTIAS